MLSKDLESKLESNLRLALVSLTNVESANSHDFYKTLHPLLLMLVFDMLAMAFNVAALAVSVPST